MTKDLFIETDEQLEIFLRKYNCKNLEELSRIYHTNTGFEVVDHRENSEYTNCNAQRDPDFWDDVNEFEL